MRWDQWYWPTGSSPVRSPTLIQSLNRLLLPLPHRERFSLSYFKLFIQLSYQSCTHKCLHVALKVKTMSLQLRSLLLLLYCKSRSKNWVSSHERISPLTAVPDVGQTANSSTSQNVTFTSLPKDHFWWERIILYQVTFLCHINQDEINWNFSHLKKAQ